jgi:uncharacterized membrane protein
MNHNNWKLRMKPTGKTFLKGLLAIIPITLTLYLLFCWEISSSFSFPTVGT